MNKFEMSYPKLLGLREGGRGRWDAKTVGLGENKKIEKKLLEYGGFKCLYSDTFFGKDQFWSMYDKEAYDRVKTKYDPQGIYLDLYQKVVNDPD